MIINHKGGSAITLINISILHHLQFIVNANTNVHVRFSVRNATYGPIVDSLWVSVRNLTVFTIRDKVKSLKENE